MRKLNMNAIPGQRYARREAGQQINTPVNIDFAGQNAGVSREQVTQESLNGLKAFGVAYTTVAGDFQPVLNLLSTAQRLKGFSFAAASAPLDSFTLLINGTKVIDSAAVAAYSTRGGAPAYLPYFPFERYLGGNKALQLIHTSAAGGVNWIFTVHYI